MLKIYENIIKKIKFYNYTMDDLIEYIKKPKKKTQVSKIKQKT